MPQPNILLFSPDDCGKEQFGFLGLGTAPYPTLPTVLRLVQNGVVFRRAYTQPICSPTRSEWNTGCLCFRTGIGGLAEGASQPLLAGEVCLPNAIDQANGAGVYKKALFGKWHLSTFQSVGGEGAHPITVGYDYFCGQMRNLEPGETYRSWTKIIAQRRARDIDVRTEYISEYLPLHLVNCAIRWMSRTAQPWFINFATDLPHGPFERPPDGWYDADTWVLDDIAAPENAGLAATRPYYKAQIEACDFSLGLLLSLMPPSVLGNTIVIYWPDNGTPANVIDDNVNGANVKRSVGELGCNTPLIIAGPGVSQPGRQTQALVKACDLWATILAMTTGTGSVSLPSGHGRDAQSFWGVCQGATDTHRSYVWLDTFSPNGQYTNCSSLGARAVVQSRYKLRKGVAVSGTTFPSSSGGTTNSSDSFWDLTFDPFETQNLIGAGSPFVSGSTITLTDVHPDHPGAKTAYDLAVTQFASQTTSL